MGEGPSKCIPHNEVSFVWQLPYIFFVSGVSYLGVA